MLADFYLPFFRASSTSCSATDVLGDPEQRRDPPAAPVVHLDLLIALRAQGMKASSGPARRRAARLLTAEARVRPSRPRQDDADERGPNTCSPSGIAVYGGAEAVLLLPVREAQHAGSSSMGCRAASRRARADALSVRGVVDIMCRPVEYRASTPARRRGGMP